MVGDNISLVQALGISILGFSIVFVVLAVLILVVKIISSLFGEKQPKPASLPKTAAGTAVPAASPAKKPAAAAAEIMDVDLAPGTAGGCELHGVDPKIAAMLMAIVADKTGLPLNELRFRSIREIQ